MVSRNLRRLVAKLNDSCRTSLERGIGLCVSRHHENVCLEHWLSCLLDGPPLDLHLILKHYDVDVSRLRADLAAALDRFNTGHERTPSLSPEIPQWIERAWAVSSIDFNEPEVRSGHLLIALHRDDQLRRLATRASSQLGRVSLDADDQITQLMAESPESSGRVLTQASAIGIQYGAVFICYRREDWATAGRIYDSLSRYIGAKNVFRDIDTIGPGDDWTRAIQKHVGSCSALLVVMGKSWKSPASLRQLNNQDDFVRYEISTALGRNIKVVPLLFDGAKMPGEQHLPEDIRALKLRQGITISDSNFAETMEKLAMMLRRESPAGSQPAPD